MIETEHIVKVLLRQNIIFAYVIFGVNNKKCTKNYTKKIHLNRLYRLAGDVSLANTQTPEIISV